MRQRLTRVTLNGWVTTYKLRVPQGLLSVLCTAVYALVYIYIYIYLSLSLCEIRLGVYKFGVLLGSWNSSICQALG